MKILYRQTTRQISQDTQEDFGLPTLREDIEKTRSALEIAYAGFDNATEPDMIDCYIYEINALLKRYKHLTELSASQPPSRHTSKESFSPIRALESLLTG